MLYKIWRKVYAYVVIVVLIVYFPIGVSAYTFTIDLGYGETHPDVKELQKELNKYPETTVASPGEAGGVGQETYFFGRATEQAVMKYQRIHLNVSTGFFGPKTRSFMNAHQYAPDVVDFSKDDDSTASNTVAFETLFPDESISKDSNIRITELSPSKATIASKIVIHGEGFERSNTIYSVLGTIKNVPVKDGAITFKVSDFPEMKKFNEGTNIPGNLLVNIRIGNKSGISSNFGYFILN